MKVMQEMFEASVDGKAYDPDKWSSYFKPAGMNFGSNDDDAPRAAAPAPVAAAPTAPVAEAAPVVAPVEEPKVEAAPAAGADKAQDILAMIRARQS